MTQIRTVLRLALAAMFLGALSLAAVAGSDAGAPAAAPAPQAGTSEGKAAPAAASGNHEYTLQIGDLLSVTVLGEPAYSGSFAVRGDGTILFADDVVGAVPVAGLTAQKATEAISAKVGEYVKSPSVVLSVSRFKVVVAGEVRQPGQYDIDSGTRVMDAVQRAGGALDEKRDLDQVFLTKASGEETQLSLRALKEDGDGSQNPSLSPGDGITVGRPRAGGRAEYKVTGAVKKPGSYPIPKAKPVRVSDAVEEAERWTDQGYPRGAQLIRKDGTKTVIDLMQVDQDSTSGANLVLEDGDELFVPRNVTQVNVLGGVKKPGQYSVPPDTSLLEAIAVAGGLEDTAILKGCVVIRGGPNGTRLPADLERLTKQGDMTQNPVLMDRDVVFVPMKPRETGTKKNVMESLSDSFLRYWWLFRVL